MEQGGKGNTAPPNIRLGARRYLGNGAFVDAQVNTRVRYFEILLECLQKTEVYDDCDKRVDLEEGLATLAVWSLKAHIDGNKTMFFGNGGSQAICSHMAIDWTKNGPLRSMCFSDAAALTCLTNDFGYQQVYSKQIEYHGSEGDVAVVISTSGRSLNLVEAANAALTAKCRAVATFTGMDPNNRLRQIGSLNFYVPCMEYGLVELAHATLLHSIVSVPR